MNSKIKIKVIGKDVNRFLIRLNKNKINVYQVSNKKNNSCYLIIDYCNYSNVLNIKTIYEIEIVEYLGAIRLKNNILKNKVFIFALLICFIILLFLSRLTYSIKVTTNDKKMNDLLIKELKEEGIYKFSFLKNYNQLNKIKNNILKKYNDKFEWLEIERVGTGYIIRYEQRLKSDDIKDIKTYDIVAKKNGRIINLDIESGQILKNINEYVNIGDIIVSSDIKLNEEIKGSISAKGKVYGEVWYKVNVKLPKDYYLKKYTGKYVNTYSFALINKKIILKKDKFHDKIVNEKQILKNNLLPIAISKLEIKEITIKKDINLKEVAINEALNKIKANLNDNEYILDYVIIDTKKNNSKFEMNLFVSVCEDIGEYLVR